MHLPQLLLPQNFTDSMDTVFFLMTTQISADSEKFSKKIGPECARYFPFNVAIEKHSGGSFSVAVEPS